MITRGLVTYIDYKTARCLVRLPIFENTKGQKLEMPAMMLTYPGITPDYNLGDTVFIAFCDNALNAPIVLGKIGNESLNLQSANFRSFNQLEVQDLAKFPMNTNFELDSESNIYNNYNSFNKIVNEIIRLKALLPDLATKDTSIFKFIIEDGKAYVAGFAAEQQTVSTIPEYTNEGIEVIGITTAAFKDCNEIEYIYLPSTIQSIGTNAFSGCTKLNYLVLPQSVKSISKGSITCRVYYEGDLQAWQAVSKNISSNLVYTYSEIKLEQEGQFWHYVAGIPTPWEAHEHMYEQISSTAPTCVDKGSITFKCSTCQKETIEYTSSLGYSYHQILVPVTKDVFYYTQSLTGFYWDSSKYIIEALSGGTVTVKASNDCEYRFKVGATKGSNTLTVYRNGSTLLSRTIQNSGEYFSYTLSKGDTLSLKLKHGVSSNKFYIQFLSQQNGTQTTYELQDATPSVLSGLSGSFVCQRDQCGATVQGKK